MNNIKYTIKRTVHFTIALMASIILYSATALGANKFYFWSLGSSSEPYFNTAPEGCDFLYSGPYKHLIEYYTPTKNFYRRSTVYDCATTLYDQPLYVMGSIFQEQATCPNGTTFSLKTRDCREISLLGMPDNGKTLGVCNSTPSSLVGNPINVANGNKIQVEHPFGRGRYSDFWIIYNSTDGIWRDSFSASIIPEEGFILMIKADGGQKMFFLTGDSYYDSTGIGFLKKTDTQWVYTDSDNSISRFSENGRLLDIEFPLGEKITVSTVNSVDGETRTISNNFGQFISISKDLKGQFLSFTSEATSALVKYDSNGNLISVSKTNEHTTTTKSYLYENSSYPNVLTGIIDERGLRFATWAYDSTGRAVSSEHANGIEKNTLSFNDDGSTTATNQFGKKTIYSFKSINGVKHIVNIDGEPSSNCPASNSSYTYDDIGHLLTKTDAKGFITAYTYNDRGLETSRTEASGTPQARVTTTEWDPTRFLRTKVVEPTRTTVYTYDDQGRETGRQVSAR